MIDVDYMSAGPELNVLIAEQVMEWRRIENKNKRADRGFAVSWWQEYYWIMPNGTTLNPIYWISPPV